MSELKKVIRCRDCKHHYTEVLDGHGTRVSICFVRSHPPISCADERREGDCGPDAILFEKPIERESYQAMLELSKSIPRS